MKRRIGVHLDACVGEIVQVMLDGNLRKEIKDIKLQNIESILCFDDIIGVNRLAGKIMDLYSDWPGNTRSKDPFKDNEKTGVIWGDFLFNLYLLDSNYTHGAESTPLYGTGKLAKIVERIYCYNCGYAPYWLILKVLMRFDVRGLPSLSEREKDWLKAIVQENEALPKSQKTLWV